MAVGLKNTKGRIFFNKKKEETFVPPLLCTPTAQWNVNFKTLGRSSTLQPIIIPAILSQPIASETTDDET